MWRKITALIAVVSLQGCFATREKPPPFPHHTPTADQVLDSLRSRRKAIHSLRSMAKLRYESPRGNESARHILVLERPDRIRIEVLSILGTLLALTSDGENFAAYVPREQTVYRGASSADNISAYIPIDLTVADLIDHALGTPPLDLNNAITVDSDQRGIRVSQVRGTNTRIGWYRPDLTPIAYQELGDNARVLLDATYSDIETIDSTPITTTIELSFPASKQKVKISLRDPEINPRVKPSIFSLPSPAGTHEVDLDTRPY